MSRAFWSTALLATALAALATAYGCPPLVAAASWAWAVGLVGTIDIRRTR